MKIFCYHGIVKKLDKFDRFFPKNISVNQFKEQVRFLKKNNRVLSLAEFEDKWGKRKLVKNDALLFFDDGYRSALNGFEILKCSALRDDYVLSAIVRKRNSLDLLAFHAAQDRIRQEILTFIDRFPSKSVAIWGAGHQALTMISLTGIADKFKYVVDSAPFKQEKFTPASHLPIVSPDTLKRSPVSALIVMAASYSDEVAGIVRQRYGDDLPLSILRELHLEIV